MKNPIIVINFKTYKQGKEVVNLAKAIGRINKNIIIGVQATDIEELAKKTKLKIFSEHADYQEPGRNTGFILPEAIKKQGAVGTFLNHSEHKIPFSILKKTMERCKKIKLKTLVFAANISEAKKIQKLKPDYLVIEPPELVAGKISVSTAKPELIKLIKKEVKAPFLVGAGIRSKKDIITAIKLGADGIAVSSAVVKTRNPAEKLKRLIQFSK